LNDTAKRLIAAGADVHVVNHADKNLVQYAEDYDNDEMMAYLTAKGVAYGA
jgi:hypothetical protein